jgi:hypothetical protein
MLFSEYTYIPTVRYCCHLASEIADLIDRRYLFVPVINIYYKCSNNYSTLFETGLTSLPLSEVKGYFLKLTEYVAGVSSEYVSTLNIVTLLAYRISR